MFRVNKEKCIGCRACIANCPGATKIGEDGKAEIVDQEKLEECGGESVCPLGAIERVQEKEREGETPPTSSSQASPRYKSFPGLPSYGPPFGGRGLGRGRGPGWSRGMGRKRRRGRR